MAKQPTCAPFISSFERIEHILFTFTNALDIYMTLMMDKRRLALNGKYGCFKGRPLMREVTFQEG
jgi:hypothetical protein